MKLVGDVLDAGAHYALFDSLNKNWFFFLFLWALKENANNFFCWTVALSDPFGH